MKGNEDGLDRPGVVPNTEVVRFSIVVRNQTRAAPSRPHGWRLGVERGPVPDQTVSKSDVSSLGWHCSVHGCQRGPEGLEFTSFLRDLSGAGKLGVGRSEVSAGSSASSLRNLPIFSGPSTHTRGLRGEIMAEIHDQFDTILILDFGSQVRSQLALVPKDLMKDSTV